jgi:hypothetical protein
MIPWILPLILSTQWTAPIEQDSYTETVFEIDFGPSSDLNYDQWPDKWTRRRGMGFPEYVGVGIAEDPNDTSGDAKCLRMDLDGGGATAYSPPIEISPQFSYVFQGKLKTRGLKHDVAYFSVSFYDRERNQKETITTEQTRGVTDWRELQIGPISPTNREARWAVIGLHLVPTERADLRGSAMFTDIRLARLPNMAIETTQPHNLFSSPYAPEITCRVLGVEHQGAHVLLELLDVSGFMLMSEELQLSADTPVQDDATWSGDLASGVLSKEVDDSSRGSVVTWRPQIPDYGFYHIRASLRSDDRVTLQHTISLAVMRDLELQRQGEFGWAIPRDSHNQADDDLISLLSIANASWVKYPIWYAPDDDAEGERIARLADRLSATGIETVGVFDRPPREVFKRYGSQDYLSVAEAFMEPDLWQPAIDPLMIRLSLKIRWWQLGTDNEESFIDYGDLATRVEEIRQYLKKFGQRTRIGLAWKWMYETPGTSKPPWDFLSMTESPAFTSDELQRYASHVDTHGAQEWVTLSPLPRSKYDYEDRARDLILRMIAAKIDGMKAIFASNPFDESRGLLNKDGTPNDMFLPWCITSKLISGAEYLGSIELPGGSSNHLFAYDDEAVMVVWNEHPTTESLYLGENAVRIDPWGRETPLGFPKTTGEPQHVAVGPLPAFIKGIDRAIAQWRLQFSFEPDRLASMFGRRQNTEYQFANSFGQGVSGNLELHLPEVWDVRNKRLRFKLGTGDTLRQELGVVLHANASSGPQQVRIDFDLIADKQYRFSVYRTIQVGLGDVVAELDTWINDEGKLIVEQHLMNRTDERLDFNCYLFAPGRRRMRIQVFDIGPGRVTHTFALQASAASGLEIGVAKLAKSFG